MSNFPSFNVNTSNVVRLASGAGLGFSSASDNTGAADVALSRTSAAIIALGNGTAGNATGTLRVTTVQAPSATTLNLGGGAATQLTIASDGSVALAGTFTLTGTADVPFSISTTSTSASGRAAFFSAPATLTTGIKSQVAIVDANTSLATGAGGGLALSGLVQPGSYATFISLYASKTNANDNDRNAYFVVACNNTVNTGTNNCVATLGVSDLVAKLNSGVALGWTSSATNVTTTALDTGLSRTAAATVAIGNGTAGNATGTLKVTTIQAPASTSLDLLAGNAEFFLNQNTVSTLQTSTPRTSFIPGEVLTLTDRTAFAAGVGAGITFQGITDGVPTGNIFASIQGFKENGTSGNALGGLRFYTNPAAASTPVEAGRFTSGGIFNLLSTGVFGLTASSSSTATADTGLSRTAAATIAIGNGTQGNVSGTFNATTLSASGAVYGGTNTPSTSNSYALLGASDIDIVMYASSLPIGNSALIRGISRRGTHASPTDAANTDHLLDIQAHGTTNGNVSAYISFIASAASGANSIPTDIALLQVATGSVVTALETFRFKNVGTLASTSTGVYGWCAAADLTTSADTGLSRLSAAAIAVGNGTASNASGLIQAAKHATTSTSVFWSSGTNSPEGAVTAAVGSLFTRTDGGANTTLYVKESGAGNTGWVAK